MKLKDEIMSSMEKLKKLLNDCGFRAEILDDGSALTFCFLFMDKRIMGLSQPYDTDETIKKF